MLLSLKRSPFLLPSLAFILLFLPYCTPPPTKEVPPDYWAVMCDSSLTPLERMEAHSQLMRLEPWDSSYLLLANLPEHARDLVLEACFRAQRIDKFYLTPDDTTIAPLISEDLRWLLQHRKVIGVSELNDGTPLSMLLSYYQEQSQIDSAIVLIERTYPSWHKFKAFNEIELHNTTVEVFTLQGDYSKALLFLKKGMSLARRADAQIHHADYYAELANILYFLGLNEEALFAYAQCVAKAEAAPHTQQTQYPDVYRFANQIITAETEEIALGLYDKALKHIGPTYEQDLKVQVYAALARYYVLRNLNERAIDPLTTSIDFAQRYGRPLDALTGEAELTGILSTIGQTREAINLGRSIESELRERSMRSDLLSVYEELENGYEQLGLQDSSYYYNRLAAGLTKEIGTTKRLAVDVANIMNASLREEAELIQAQEKELMQTELARQRLVLILTGVGFLVACGLIYLGWRLYQVRQQSIRLLSARGKELESTNKRLERFVGVVSHDVLTRLDLVLSTGHVLVGDIPEQNTLQKYYETSQRISTELKTYCLDLLEESRSTTPLLLLNRSEAEAIVDDVLQAYEQDLNLAGFQVFREALTSVNLPAVILQQLMHNLVSNALKYAPLPNKAPILRITAEAGPDGNSCWVIEDNGPGLSSAAFKDVPAEGNSPTKKQGRGIGLKLLQSQLALYGARLSLESSQLGGLRVVVFFAGIDRNADEATSETAQYFSSAAP